MGRHKSIDREHVLAIAERIVAETGAASLTIGAVANAAGITKGGVQSCFGTKEAMIGAMLERWTKSYEERVRAIVPPEGDVKERVAAHAEITLSREESQERGASLLAALLQSPENLGPTRDWYRDHMQDMDPGTQKGRDALVAFMATEGAFLVRYLGLVSFDDDQWEGVRRGIDELSRTRR
ncbi:hypothetical protein B5K08_13545 [Rhizobium leguminosarum bv. trifolii]|uniref:HTH tetR-type domain-containing protein n=1 Tax=Rhizobium leguminosarum bv. trifolii TaxID=386 RepID=A0A3E1BJD6_RHILT|nr:TetR family transcriptional regulator [Rhizobium leguminosarum]RFB91367.1 hypothetical protein B5K08_13545 [Rhizobium leguminosarum bv. trifolii]RFB92992.1 hypothetical protein B5K10_13540 [Rhizobium leguminosarum bv. trifolii]